MKVGYIRSTIKEEVEQQSELLIQAGFIKFYVEPSNNINFKQKEKLNQAISSVEEGDILSVTRLSVLSHSVQNLLQIMYQLQDKQILLEAIDQQYRSNENHSMDELLYYLSEFVEDLKREKQVVGIYRAKMKGKRLGRPPLLTKNKVIKAIDLKRFNTSEQVANRLGVGRSTLLRDISKYRKAG